MQPSLSVRALIGSAIFLAALAVVIIRPYRLPEAITALVAGGGLLRHGPRGGPERAHALDAAEIAAGEQALAEAEAAARDAGAPATTRLEHGKPEQVMVALAREAAARLIVIRARDWVERHPVLGPGSVGHTARFVLDHAPCEVLLVRQLAHP